MQNNYQINKNNGRNNLSNQQDYKMKEQSTKDHSTSKSSFLQKFSGKLNIITKHGQIKDDNTLKLPVINSPVMKRSNTMNFRPSKISTQSFFSNRRSGSSKSAIIRHRAQKYLTQNIDRENMGVSDKFLKKSDSRNLKKISLRPPIVEPLSAQPFSHKFKSTRKNTSGDQSQNYTQYFNAGSKMGNSDYHNFLKQLNGVSDAMNQRRKTINRNDKENIKM